MNNTPPTCGLTRVRYVGPSLTAYTTRTDAFNAREAETAHAAQIAASRPSDPAALIGWRVSVVWKGEGEGEDGWYHGQIMGCASRLYLRDYISEIAACL